MPWITEDTKVHKYQWFLSSTHLTLWSMYNKQHYCPHITKFTTIHILQRTLASTTQIGQCSLETTRKTLKSKNRLGYVWLGKVRGRPKTTLTKFCPVLSTYLPIVDLRWHLRMYLLNVNVDICKTTPSIMYLFLLPMLCSMWFKVWWRECSKDAFKIDFFVLIV